MENNKKKSHVIGAITLSEDGVFFITYMAPKVLGISYRQEFGQMIEYSEDLTVVSKSVAKRVMRSKPAYIEAIKSLEEASNANSDSNTNTTEDTK